MRYVARFAPVVAVAALLVVVLGAAEPSGKPIASYDFEETDETQTTVKDTAGPPFSHGTLEGKDGTRPEFIEFRKGKALRFQSRKVQHVLVDAEDALKGAFEKGLTISATIRFDKIPTEKEEVFTIFSRYDYATQNRAFSLAVRNRKEGRMLVEWSVSDDGKRAIATYTPSGMKMGTVYDVTVVFDPAGVIETYVDGKLRVKKKVEMNKLHAGPAPVMIGCRVAKGRPGNPFNGVIDNLKVYGAVVRPKPMDESKEKE